MRIFMAFFRLGIRGGDRHGGLGRMKGGGVCFLFSFISLLLELWLEYLPHLLYAPWLVLLPFILLFSILKQRGRYCLVEEGQP